MIKKHLYSLIFIIVLIFSLSACSNTEQKNNDKNLIDLISEQPDSNTAYWYVVSNDSFILKQDIEELIDILSLETWKPTNEVVNDKLSRDIVINFNKFPEGKDEQNFDYNMGTFVTNQLTISKENQMVFDGHSNGDTVYSLDSDIINAIQLFIETKAISKEALVEKMN